MHLRSFLTFWTFELGPITTNTKRFFRLAQNYKNTDIVKQIYAYIFDGLFIFVTILTLLLRGRRRWYSSIVWRGYIKQKKSYSNVKTLLLNMIYTVFEYIFDYWTNHRYIHVFVNSTLVLMTRKIKTSKSLQPFPRTRRSIHRPVTHLPNSHFHLFGFHTT